MSVMVNEPEILERFGIEVVPYASGRFFQDVQHLAVSDDPEFLRELRVLADKMDVAALTETKLRNIAAMIVVVKRAMDQHQCTGATMECWSSLPPLLEVVPCQVIGELTDRGYPVACEADVHGAISSVLAAGSQFRGSAHVFRGSHHPASGE